MPDQHDTPVTFSRAEMREIRKAVGEDEVVHCPHCATTLTIRGPIAGGGTQGPVWHIECEACHRAAFLTEVPGSRRPGAEES